MVYRCKIKPMNADGYGVAVAVSLPCSSACIGGSSALCLRHGGGVDQLVRSSPCHGEGCGFEPRRSRQNPRRSGRLRAAISFRRDLVDAFLDATGQRRQRSAWSRRRYFGIAQADCAMNFSKPSIAIDAIDGTSFHATRTAIGSPTNAAARLAPVAVNRTVTCRKAKEDRHAQQVVGRDANGRHYHDSR